MIFQKVTVDLVIASFRIRLQSEDGIDIVLDQRFRAFINKEEAIPDVLLDIYPEKGSVPDEAEKVFEASLIDEEGKSQEREPFWEVLKSKEAIYVQARTKYPERNPLMVLNKEKMKWRIFSDCGEDDIDPLPYPVDGLLLYYLTSFLGGIMIHGSGADVNGKGWLFSGRSGMGKTTLAMIFDKCGDKIMHDDRLILRKGESGWVMHSTPVYSNDEPRSINLDHLWVIGHGHSNVSVPVTGAEAAGLVMANCVQQNWNNEATARLAAAIGDLVLTVPVSKLQFVPDKTVRDYLVAHEDKEMKSAFLTAAALLDNQSVVSITAGGYSMWPAIKPGDKVLIEPLKEKEFARGDVVALIRDGGYVVHRVTDISLRDMKKYFKTQGDASLRADHWSQKDDIAGIVRNIIRSGKKQKVGRRIFPILLNKVLIFFRKQFDAVN